MDNCLVILEGDRLFVFFFCHLAVVTDVNPFLFFCFLFCAESVYDSVGYSPPLLSLWGCLISVPHKCSKERDGNTSLCITRGTGIQPRQVGLTWGLALVSGMWGEFDSKAWLKHVEEPVLFNCILSPLPVATI